MEACDSVVWGDEEVLGSQIVGIVSCSECCVLLLLLVLFAILWPLSVSIASPDCNPCCIAKDISISGYLAVMILLALVRELFFSMLIVRPLFVSFCCQARTYISARIDASFSIKAYVADNSSKV